MTAERYVVLEHEVGKPFDPPDEAAQVVKCCGHVERDVGSGRYYPVPRTFVLVLWVMPARA